MHVIGDERYIVTERRGFMGQPSDEALAQRTLTGDTDAFAVLVDRYQRTVYNLAYRMLDNAQEAEDVTQEVFIRTYQSLRRYDPSRRFFSWIYRIAINCCLTARSKPSARSLDPATEAALLDPALLPEQQVARSEMRMAVRRAIVQLPAHERSLVALRYGADLSYEEIAATMQLPLGTVKNRLFR